MFRILFICTLQFSKGQEIYFCSGHQYLQRLFSVLLFRYASCDLRKHHNYISYVTYVFDLSIFYDISWNFSWRYISVRMFFFDMFSGDIFSIESLFTNCTLKSCEIQMSVIMTLQIFFIPKILWRRTWFNYWKLNIALGDRISHRKWWLTFTNNAFVFLRTGICSMRWLWISVGDWYDLYPHIL